MRSEPRSPGRRLAALAIGMGWVVALAGGCGGGASDDDRGPATDLTSTATAAARSHVEDEAGITAGTGPAPHQPAIRPPQVPAAGTAGGAAPAPRQHPDAGGSGRPLPPAAARGPTGTPPAPRGEFDRAAPMSAVELADADAPAAALRADPLDTP